ncbi:hypothetical protein RBH29_02865 [Herbivorax sp. ANBcel31]|uniref:hypothetical protein n=1 Tax=Herbivorax sp. ANBcel31 TaxID=3069754 RepID=UPI0027ADC35B|nr:hypothetical protein [Herbivorax sp. ANBcel31]MDQ2085380.1 hypothetical protein [Herbivorax sp. ANBcel31]
MKDYLYGSGDNWKGVQLILHKDYNLDNQDAYGSISNLQNYNNIYNLFLQLNTENYNNISNTVNTAFHKKNIQKIIKASMHYLEYSGLSFNHAHKNFENQAMNFLKNNSVIYKKYVLNHEKKRNFSKPEVESKKDSKVQVDSVKRKNKKKYNQKHIASDGINNQIANKAENGHFLFRECSYNFNEKMLNSTHEISKIFKSVFLLNEYKDKEKYNNEVFNIKNEISSQDSFTSILNNRYNKNKKYNNWSTETNNPSNVFEYYTLEENNFKHNGIYQKNNCFFDGNFKKLNDITLINSVNSTEKPVNLSGYTVGKIFKSIFKNNYKSTASFNMNKIDKSNIEEYANIFNDEGKRVFNEEYANIFNDEAERVFNKVDFNKNFISNTDDSNKYYSKKNDFINNTIYSDFKDFSNIINQWSEHTNFVLSNGNNEIFNITKEACKDINSMQFIKKFILSEKTKKDTDRIEIGEKDGRLNEKVIRDYKETYYGNKINYYHNVLTDTSEINGDLKKQNSKDIRLHYIDDITNYKLLDLSRHIGQKVVSSILKSDYKSFNNKNTSSIYVEINRLNKNNKKEVTSTFSDENRSIFELVKGGLITEKVMNSNSYLVEKICNFIIKNRFIKNKSIKNNTESKDINIFREYESNNYKNSKLYYKKQSILKKLLDNQPFKVHKNLKNSDISQKDIKQKPQVYRKKSLERVLDKKVIQHESILNRESHDYIDKLKIKEKSKVKEKATKEYYNNIKKTEHSKNAGNMSQITVYLLTQWKNWYKDNYVNAFKVGINATGNKILNSIFTTNSHNRLINFNESVDNKVFSLKDVLRHKMPFEEFVDVDKKSHNLNKEIEDYNERNIHRIFDTVVNKKNFEITSDIDILKKKENKKLFYDIDKQYELIQVKERNNIFTKLNEKLNIQKNKLTFIKLKSLSNGEETDYANSIMKIGNTFLHKELKSIFANKKSETELLAKNIQEIEEIDTVITKKVNTKTILGGIFEKYDRHINTTDLINSESTLSIIKHSDKLDIKEHGHADKKGQDENYKKNYPNMVLKANEKEKNENTNLNEHKKDSLKQVQKNEQIKENIQSLDSSKSKKIDIDINSIMEKVYDKLERKLDFERKRRGIF